MQANSYRKILKSTSLFGSVQLVTAITGVLKTKCIALLLGADGIGIYGLFQNTLGLISMLANVGLNNSAVREIAQNDTKDLNLTLSIVHKWALLTGIAGLILTILLSHQLSLFVFGTSAYTISFIWLALAILFDQLSSANLAILQGLRQLNYLAKANIIGSILGLIVSVPVFFLLGEKGIVPVLILSSLILLFRSWFYARKVSYQKMPISWSTLWKEGGSMIKLGITLALTGFIGMGCTYFFRIWIGRTFGFETVGYFNAAFLIIEGYAGMLFTAMSTDYYPRLSQVQTDQQACNKLINEQAEMGIILLTPLLILLAAFSDLIIRLLYSTDFIPAVTILRYALIGVLLKAVSFPFSYLFIAKSDKKVFFFEELFSWSYILASLILCSKYGGLNYMGIGYSIGYSLSAIQSIILNKYLYHTQISKSLYLLITGGLIFVIASVAAAHIESAEIRYSFLVINVIISGMSSFYLLNKRTGCWKKIREHLSGKF